MDPPGGGGGVHTPPNYFPLSFGGVRTPPKIFENLKVILKNIQYLFPKALFFYIKMEAGHHQNFFGGCNPLNLVASPLSFAFCPDECAPRHFAPPQNFTAGSIPGRELVRLYWLSTPDSIFDTLSRILFFGPKKLSRQKRGESVHFSRKGVGSWSQKFCLLTTKPCITQNPSLCQSKIKFTFLVL